LIAKALANSIIPDVDEWTLFYKIVGAMPLEFFSAKTV
jgi:hypothetical protein